MFDSIRKLLARFENQGQAPDRQQQITDTGQYIANQLQQHDFADLIFVCTHNSRRSQFAHVWASVAASHFNLSNVRCYSGGTEITACNERTVDSLRRFGFQVAVDANSSTASNPTYEVSFADEHAPIHCNSKLYTDPDLQSFAAMMCCSDVDDRCPLIPGADLRIPWHYADPKEADDTDQEPARYDERSLQIGCDMYHALKLAAKTMGSTEDPIRHIA